MAFFDIEVFEVEGAIFSDDIVIAQIFPHIDDVHHFLLVQLVVGGSNGLHLPILLWKEVHLGDSVSLV